MKFIAQVLLTAGSVESRTLSAILEGKKLKGSIAARKERAPMGIAESVLLTDGVTVIWANRGTDVHCTAFGDDAWVLSNLFDEAGIGSPAVIISPWNSNGD